MFGLVEIAIRPCSPKAHRMSAHGARPLWLSCRLLISTSACAHQFFSTHDRLEYERKRSAPMDTPTRGPCPATELVAASAAAASSVGVLPEPAGATSAMVTLMGMTPMARHRKRLTEMGPRAHNEPWPSLNSRASGGQSEGERAARSQGEEQIPFSFALKDSTAGQRNVSAVRLYPPTPACPRQLPSTETRRHAHGPSIHPATHTPVPRL